MPASLFDTLVDLARNPDARAAFDADPAGYLRQAGLGDVTPQDVHDAAPLVAETVGGSLPDANAAMNAGDGGSAIGQIQQLVHVAGPADHAPAAGHDPMFRDDSVDLDHQVRIDPRDITFGEPVHQTVPEHVSSDLAALEREAHTLGYPNAQAYVDAEGGRPHPYDNVVYDQAPDPAHLRTALREFEGLGHDAGYGSPSEFLQAAQHGLDPAVTARLMLVDEAHARGYPDVQHYLDAWHNGQIDLDDHSVGAHDVLTALVRDAGHQHESLEQLLNAHNHGAPPFEAPHDPGGLPIVDHAGPSTPDVDALAREAHAHGFPDAQHYLDAAPFPGEDNVYFRAPDPGQDFSQLKAMRAMAHDAGYDDVADFGRASEHGLSETDHARILLAQEARANGYPDGRSYLEAYHRGEVALRDPDPTDRVGHHDNHDVLRWLSRESTTHGHAGIDDYLNSGLHHGQEPVDPPGSIYTAVHEPHNPADDWLSSHRTDHVLVDPGTDPLPGEVTNPLHVPSEQVWYEHTTATHAPGLDDPTAAQQGEPGENVHVAPTHPLESHGMGALGTRPVDAGPSDHGFGTGHTVTEPESGIRHDETVDHHGGQTDDNTTVDHHSGQPDDNGSGIHDAHEYEDHHGGNTDPAPHESSSGGEEHHTDPTHSVVHGG